MTMRTTIRRLLAILAVLTVIAGLAGCTGDQAGSDSRRSLPTTRPPARPWWQPQVGSTFHIQYTGKIDLNQPVDVYNLDGDGTSAEEVAQLADRGVASVCYFNAGAYEDWRSDKGAFPEAVIGKEMDGWAGERWLDIRAVDVLLPIMAARMDTCKEKGFVGVDPDNTDGFIQDSGFDISAQDQIAYQRALAREAHARGLAIGLKNDPDQLPELAEDVDFAVNEECVKYEECDKYTDFLNSGKPVFHIEYKGTPDMVCPGRPVGMSTVIKDLKLGAASRAC